MKTKIPHYISFLAIGLVFLAGGLILTYPEKIDEKAVLPNSEVKTPINAIPAPKNSYMMKVGAFSDVECGSDWCDRHEPKNGQVALDYSKFGRVDKVYIPAYDKYYTVVGTTYSESGNRYDLEIWFGADQQAALDFGSRTLLVNIIK